MDGNLKITSDSVSKNNIYYEYNDKGKIVKITSTDGSILRYDASNNLFYLAFNNGNSYNTFEYDGSGMNVKQSNYINNVLLNYTTYSYVNGKVIEVSQYQSSGSLMMKLTNEWTGDNIIKNTKIEYYTQQDDEDDGETLQSTTISVFSDFDTSLNPTYILYQNLGLDGQNSKNNYGKSSSTINSTQPYEYIHTRSYDSKGNLVKYIEGPAQGDTTVVKFEHLYQYENCN